MRISDQDGDISKHSLPLCKTAEITTRLQDKYQLELSENQASMEVWQPRI